MAIKIGMHTDNLRSLSGSFEAGVDLGAKFHMPHVEFGVINGHYFINAMGYDPSVSLWDNPLRIRKYVEDKGMYVSQIDGAYPMMGPDGAAYGIFVLGSLALPLSDPVPSTPLLSMPRFALGVFPVFVVLGMLGARPRWHTAMLVGFTLLLGINLARWVLWIWVA